MSDLEKLIAVLEKNRFPIPRDKLEPTWPFQSGWNNAFDFVKTIKAKIEKGEL